MLTLRIVQGNAREAEWQLGPAAMGARKIVGTDPAAEWQVMAPGVAPGHIELYWDGQQLWVCDISKLGDVRLNGQPVQDWVAVAAQSRLHFGGAILDVLTHQPVSAPPGPGGAVPGFPIQGSRAQGAAAQGNVFGGAFGDVNALGAATQPGDTYARSGTDGTTELSPLKRALLQHRQRVVIGGAAAAVVLVLLLVLVFRGSSGGETVAAPVAPPAPIPAAPPTMETDSASLSAGGVKLPPVSAITGLDEPPVEQTPDGGVSASASSKKEPATEEARAAESLASGRLVQAYGRYLDLAQAHPDRPEFVVIAMVLRERLKRKCSDGVGPGGNPCSVP
jgi:hypothetical protein